MKTISDINRLIIGKLNNQYNSLKHYNCIIVGDNMAGKSYLIKDIVEMNPSNCYYLDSVNRTIPIDNPAYLFEINKIMIEDINRNRIKKTNFNKKDVFTPEVNNSIILNELIENIGDYEENIHNFFDEYITIKEGKGDFHNIIYKYKIGNNIYDEISSGYQAIIRIIVEITFAQKQGCRLVIIDEIDAHLDNTNCNKLIEFLKKNFSSIYFLLSTHSPDIILNSKDYNIIKIIKANQWEDDDRCEIFDGNDMDDLNYINRTLFSSNKRRDLKKEKNDKILEGYVRQLATTNSLTPAEKSEVLSLKNLTIKQVVLKKYILEWSI